MSQDSTIDHLKTTTDSMNPTSTDAINDIIINDGKH